MTSFTADDRGQSPYPFSTLCKSESVLVFSFFFFSVILGFVMFILAARAARGVHESQ